MTGGAAVAATLTFDGPPDEFDVTRSVGPAVGDVTAGSIDTAVGPSRPPCPPGYEIVGELGRGGMGVVYDAVQVSLHRPCALKMVLGSGHAGTVALVRFLAEAEAVAAIDHPHVVRVFEFGNHAGQPFLAMEKLDGGSLAERLKAGGPLGVAEAVVMLGQIAAGVQAGHDLGIVHRDLKPANILLTSDGTPKVTDFGLAKRDGGAGLTNTHAEMGTPDYMSPEQAKGQTKFVGPTADVYSLGAILFAALSGRPPFRAEALHELRLKVIHEEAPSLTNIVAGLPRDLAVIAAKCLAKAPAERYATAAAFADDLRRWRCGDTIVARATGSRERAWKWAKRHRGLVAAVGVVMLTLIAGLVVSLWYANEANTRRGQAEAAEGRAVRERDGADEARVTAQREKVSADAARLTAQQEKSEADLARLAAQREKGNADAARGSAVRDQRRAEWAAYTSQIMLSEREWELGNGPAAFQSLDATKADLRGWEHGYLERLYVQDRHWSGKQIIAGRTGGIIDIAVSPTGDRVASATSHGLTIWAAGDGKQLLSVPAKLQGLNCIAFSPDGSAILTGDGDVVRDELVYSGPGEIRSWNLGAGRDPSKLVAKLPGTIKSLGFNPTGSAMVVGCGDGRIYWVAYPSGDIAHSVGTIHGQDLRLALSRDGKFVATVGGLGGVELRDGTSGDVLRTFRLTAEALPGYNDRAQLAFSPDGELLASTRNGLFVWEVKSGAKLWSATDSAALITRASWLPGGASLVTASEDRTLSSWEARTGRRAKRYVGHVSGVYALGVTDSAMFSGSTDGRVIAWRTEPAPVPVIFRAAQENGWLYDVAYAPNGAGVFCTEAGRETVARLWDLRAGRNTRTFVGHTEAVTALAVTGGGGLLVTGSQDATARLWDVESGQCRAVLRGHLGAVSGVACPPTGEWVATVSHDGTAQLWDPGTGRERQKLLSRSVAGNRLATSPDGQRLAASYADGMIVVWDTATWAEVVRLSHGDVTGVRCPYLPIAFTSDGCRLTSGGSNRRLRVWDLSTGKPLWAKERDAVVAPILSIAVLPGGRQFVTGGGAFGTPGEIQVWNTETGENTFTIRATSREIYGVAVSPKDGSIAACSHEGAVKVWGLRPLPLPAELPNVRPPVAMPALPPLPPKSTNP